jgi:hypothetical protein
MPLRNRVTPFGDIIETPARGLLFGNRGVLHDDDGRLVRAWQVRRWIACLLEFRSRRRPLLRPGRFTELFLLDEATALAAGHRPCAECRYADHQRFRRALAASRTGEQAPRADDLDRVLHAERLDGRAKRTHPARLGDLPDGTMIASEEVAWLVQQGELLRWSPFGYRDRRRAEPSTRVTVLTPPSIVGAIRAGYRPGLHPSALEP